MIYRVNQTRINNELNKYSIVIKKIKKLQNELNLHYTLLKLNQKRESRMMKNVTNERQDNDLQTELNVYYCS